jgi:transcriptional regulator with XRE-family HTH domain
MMAKLSEVRRRFPPEDAEAYVKAYAEAEFAERLGALAHALRASAHLDAPQLATRMGVEEDEVLRAEEGEASTTVAYLDRVARAVGIPVLIAAAGVEVVLGQSSVSPPLRSED